MMLPVRLPALAGNYPCILLRTKPPIRLPVRDTMSSEKRKFPLCDAAMEGKAHVNSTPAPLLLIVEVFMASVVLRQGDKAQALTLRLLEETEDIMDEEMHSRLPVAYHNNYVARLKLKNSRISIMKYSQVARYKNNSVRLYTRTVATSEYARNKAMADKKGKTIFPRLRLSKRASATDLSILTADRDDGEDHSTISDSRISLLSTGASFGSMR
ncbi:hypothetical protein C8Q72DRAFT_424510 [Fomitopsis betulina]|nr:hypothetical protein C8Q72DRAFT_424510 [Fomitopsis betulina]